MAARASNARRVTFALWLADVLLVIGAVLAAEQLRFFGQPEGLQTFLAAGAWRGLLLPALVTLAMACFGLYETHVRHDRWDLFLRLALSFGFAGISLVVAYYLVPKLYIGRGILLMSLAIGFVAVLALRMGAREFWHADVLKRRVLVLGAGRNASLINSAMRRKADRRAFNVLGFVALPGQECLVPSRQVLGSDSDLLQLAQRCNIHEIVVAPDERRGGLPMEQMLACAQIGIQVTDLTSFFEREAGTVRLGVVDPSWLVFSGGFDHSLPRRLSKRFFDIVAATLLLAVAWPLMLVVALAIWIEGGGPVLYWQTRVGLGGQPFNLVKFRSMRTDAEKDGVARWASLNDDRSTRLGKFLRKTRLDELPQLFNVIRGHMSFVGPRPERPQFVDMLNQEIRFYTVRHSVKPGLTGWAQLRYPYGASVRDAEEKLMFDLFYVKNHGFLFDLMIMLQTVEVVLFGRGAR